MYKMYTRYMYTR